MVLVTQRRPSTADRGPARSSIGGLDLFGSRSHHRGDAEAPAADTATGPDAPGGRADLVHHDDRNR
ncbi:hypothetical protein G419_20935 [Rhodococcus triatomae BKS 15-14]|nr:hypothetical protein G419_20935 [Rhodococcus triatomae BKS 15-14]